MFGIHTGIKHHEVKKTFQPTQAAKLHKSSQMNSESEHHDRGGDHVSLSPDAQRALREDNPVGEFAGRVNDAREVLADNFEQISGHDDRISRDDLSRALRSHDGEEREAALFVLRNQAVQNFFDVGAGRGRVDGQISEQDLARAPIFSERNPAQGDFPSQFDIENNIVRNFGVLADTANGRGGRDGHVGVEDLISLRENNPDMPQELSDTLEQQGFDFSV